MDLDDLRALLSVLEHGSVQSAAKALSLPRSTLRRRLENLEAHVGVPLFVRDVSGVIPTPAGQALAARGRGLVEEAAALVASVRGLDAAPEGLLRVLLPVGLPPQVLAVVLALTRSRFPRLEFRATLSEDPLRELRDDVDLVLHFGAAPAAGPWVTTTVARTPERLLASPEYLATMGRPSTVEALSGHTLLSWKPPGEDGRHWPRIGGGSVEVAPLLVSADVHLVRQLAASGLGIARVPDGDVPDALTLRAALEPVLSDQIGRPFAVRAMVPEAMAPLPKGRAILAVFRELVAGLDAMAGIAPPGDQIQTGGGQAAAR